MAHNTIERSLFRPGQYVGYGHGQVWHITRTSNGWTATGTYRFEAREDYMRVTRRTLAELDAYLQGAK